MRHTTLVCVVASLPVCAQEVVLPPSAAVAEARTFSGFPLTGHSGRHQFIIDRTLLAPLPQGWHIRELWFRRDMTLATRTMLPGVVDLDVLAGNSPASAQGPSEEFQRNRASDVTRVFQGRVLLPAAGPAPGVPAPWLVPYAIQIPFNQPVMDRGGNLLIEILASQPAGLPESPFWIVDTEAFPDPGSVAEFGQGCSNRVPSPTATASVASLLPGNTSRFLLQFAPVGSLALHVLGFSNQTLFGAPVLPLDLAPFGAGGCTLYTDWNSVSTHAAVNSPGRRLAVAGCDLRWPLDSQFLGASVYSQWLILQPFANPLGLVPTNAAHIQLGTQLSPHGMALVSTGDPLAATGRVRTDVAPVLRLR